MKDHASRRKDHLKYLKVALNSLEKSLAKVDTMIFGIVKLPLEKILPLMIEEKFKTYQQQQEGLSRYECEKTFQTLYDKEKTVWENSKTNNHRRDFEDFLSNIEVSFKDVDKSRPHNVLDSTWRHERSIFEKNQVHKNLKKELE